MKKFKKIAASVAALATAVTMSVGTLAVTANEVTKDLATKKSYTVAEEQFIASYGQDEAADVAKYLIDNGVSIKQSKELVEKHINARKKTAQYLQISRNNYPSFYDSSRLSSNQHYALLMSYDGSLSDNDIAWYVSYSSSYVGFSSPIAFRTLSPSSDLSCSQVSSYLKIEGDVDLNGTYDEIENVCDFPFNVITTNTNESSLHSSYNIFTYTTYDEDIICETYVRGDINHDGIVDDTDYDLLLDYNLRRIYNFDFNYSDRIPEDAGKVNMLAADVNRDGTVGIADLLAISDYDESNGNE